MIPSENITDSINGSGENRIISLTDGTERPFSFSVSEDEVTVLIFFKAGCMNCSHVLESVAESIWIMDPAIHVMAVESNQAELSTTRAYIDSVLTGGQQQRFEIVSGRAGMMWDYAHLLGLDHIRYPLTLLIKGDEICYYKVGLCSASVYGDALENVLGRKMPQIRFADVPQEHWGHDYIERMSEKGFIHGAGNGLYLPAHSVSNAQFCTMLTRGFYGSELPKSQEGEPWWKGSCEFALEHGLLEGTDFADRYQNNGGFWMEEDAVQPMNRYDLAKVMNLLIIQQGAADPVNKADIQNYAQYQILDYSQIPDNALEAVVNCYRLGLLKGKEGGNFAGLDRMTRAEAAAVMYRLNTRL